MTAVVCHAVNVVLRGGVCGGARTPRHGQCEFAVIQGLTGTIGGHRMAEELTGPAIKFSAALAKNLVSGDSIFIHYT
eukprot:16442729-Heterocapsa_arctica.AAC.1